MWRQVMHSEDNELGLKVKNPAGETWIVYGDKKWLDEENVENLRRLYNALTESADEIFGAWKTRKVVDESSFRTWKHAPVLDSANDPANHSALFNPERKVGTSYEDRFTTKYESFISWITLAAGLELSSAFKHPMKK
ncbi:hypothetical protein LZ31DRAFT_325386 [Colletotrichum somersetense]|nr:hypothetical protein LZ31DRAFT_325386 [Colletotrichum somersetense]